ncbi:MAG: hypothetical protein Q3M24_07255 [Candidatus Electrothrix aestuarii]|uniref:Uncharacterized protein n=1 Tax=Candidatus Electrothrix aestuarii TaxID=3062594 RepID=A0AAU8LZD6_9BACT|nr:hypothetical protein [Candidatus Electrothrix aestuarii]
MEFGIGMEIEEEAFQSGSCIHRFVDNLSEYIRERDYGSGIEHFTIGLVVIRSKPGYEDWFKQRKPLFRKIQKIQIPGQDITEFYNCYSYDIKLSDAEIDRFIESGESAINLFCQKFISSLINFDSPSMKKRDFDLCAFREDVLGFIDSWKFT